MKAFTSNKTRAAAALLLHSLVLYKKLTIRKERSYWVHPIWKKRKIHGQYRSLVNEMRTQDPSYFKKYMRMTPQEFDELKDLLRPKIKKHPNGRKAISVGEQLAITLRFLASGDSMMSISFAFRIGFTTAHNIILNTCDALWKVLCPISMPVPKVEDWAKIADDYNSLWQYPCCVGAVDGKHVMIKAPPNSGSLYYNYKSFNSIVLMAVVDSKYKFIMVDVGAFGSNSDGGIWKNSKFGKSFDSQKIPMPEPITLPLTDSVVPYVMIGDEAFELNSNFMKPYRRDQLNNRRRIYNYRHSRARRCSENAFGIMVNRLRVLRGCLEMKPENCDKIVKACTVLHNFLMQKAEQLKEQSVYCPPSFQDRVGANGEIIPGTWRLESNPDDEIGPTPITNRSSSGEETREKLCDFFNGVGEVEWQEKYSFLQSEY